MQTKNWTRRQVLKGAGVTLALPWLEMMAPRKAYAQAAPRKRFVNLYFPNGTAEFWKCSGGGTGDTAWQLSPIMAPLEPSRKHLVAMTNVSNNAPFGGGNPEPSHSNLGASTYSCVKPAGGNNGITVDQVIANAMAMQPGATKLHSLQVGLSTHDSSPDGLPAQHSRSMAWKSATEPLYKIINPQTVFDRLVATGTTMPSMGGNTSTTPDPVAERRRLLRKSSLDYIIESTQSLQTRLGKSDVSRLDKFLTSARALEQRVLQMGMQVQQVTQGCRPIARPGFGAVVGTNGAEYNRNNHAEVMIDLVVMALQCDTTRVVSFMLDDARSDYVYNFVPLRAFTDGGSTPTTGAPGNYHETQHSGDRSNTFATIGHWNAQKANQFAQKLAASLEGEKSILDNSVVVFNSGMHGGNHDAGNIPTALLGSGGGVLKTNTFHNFAGEKQLGNIYVTLMRNVYGMQGATIGSGNAIIPELLA
jgi:hypothetical protein